MSWQNSVFFFGKTTEILGKTNFGEKKSRWIFFYREKSIVIFLTRINSKSHREFFEHIYHIYRENLNRYFLPRKTWSRLFTKKKSTEMFYRIKLAETFYQEKRDRDFFRGKTDRYFIFHRENLNRVFLPRKAWPRFFTEKKVTERKWTEIFYWKTWTKCFTEKTWIEIFYREKLTEIFYHILKPKTFTEKNWPIYFTEKNLTQILTEKM